MQKNFFANLCISLFAIALLLTCYSCKKESVEPELNISSISSKEYNPEKEFAIILSKAVHENKDLRLFLKNESLKQFDYDYDVFYPNTKDKYVAGTKTFREVLLDYCESESQLNRIEGELPLLNILLPDMAWIDPDLFSAKSWDVENDNVMVTYREGNKEREFIENGNRLFVLGDGELPGGPILVVKNNERLKCSPSTRSVELGEYEFVADEFDNTRPRETKVAWETTVTTYEETVEESSADWEFCSHLLDYSEMALDAFREFGANPKKGCQRDYCYYGITKTDSVGVLNPNVKEGLYRFRIADVDRFILLCDDTSVAGKDPIFNTEIKYDGSDNGANTGNLFGLMTDGYLEFVFYYVYGTVNGGTVAMNKYIPLKASELLRVKKVTKQFKHETWFNDNHWIYDVEFDVKWYYPKNIEFFNWNLFTTSTLLSINIRERDSGVTETREHTDSWSFAEHYSFDASLGVTGKFDIKAVGVTAAGKNGYGYKTDETTSSSTKVSYTVTNMDDDLGWTTIHYKEDFLLDEAPFSVCPKNYTTGGVMIFSVIPFYQTSK